MASNTNKYLPTNFRDFTGCSKLLKVEERNFIRCFSEWERMAILNNLVCSDWAINSCSEVHQSFLSGGIGYRIIDCLKDKTVNGNIRIECNGADDKEMIDKISEIFTTKLVKKIFWQSLSKGAVVVKIDLNEFEPFITIVPLGRFSLDITASGKVNSSSCYLDLYQTKNAKNKYYSIVEYRYYDSSKKPMVEYKVQLTNFKSGGYLDDSVSNNLLEYKDIPKEIIEKYKDEYDFSKKTVLPFKTLGIFLINNTENNTHFPTAYFGESQLMPGLDLLYTVDHSLTAKEVDKYLGRGRTLIPEIMQKRQMQTPTLLGPSFTATPISNSDNAVFIPTPLDETFYTSINSYDIEKQKPTNIQFDLRTEEWWLDIKNTDCRLAIVCGLSPGDLNPELVNGVQKTDDQVDAEKDITTATVMSKRALAIEEFNAIVNEIAYAIKSDNKFSVVFLQSGLTNTTARINSTINLYNAGLMSQLKCLSEIHPDWTMKEIEDEASRLAPTDLQNTADIFKNLGEIEEN